MELVTALPASLRGRSTHESWCSPKTWLEVKCEGPQKCQGSKKELFKTPWKDRKWRSGEVTQQLRRLLAGCSAQPDNDTAVDVPWPRRKFAEPAHSRQMMNAYEFHEYSFLTSLYILFTFASPKTLFYFRSFWYVYLSLSSLDVDVVGKTKASNRFSVLCFQDRRFYMFSCWVKHGESPSFQVFNFSASVFKVFMGQRYYVICICICIYIYIYI